MVQHNISFFEIISKYETDEVTDHPTTHLIGEVTSHIKSEWVGYK